MFVCVCAQSLCLVQLFAIPRAEAHEALLSVKFSRQGYWSGLPFASPGYLPNPGTEHNSPTLQVDFPD